MKQNLLHQLWTVTLNKQIRLKIIFMTCLILLTPESNIRPEKLLRSELRKGEKILRAESFKLFSTSSASSLFPVLQWQILNFTSEFGGRVLIQPIKTLQTGTSYHLETHLNLDWYEGPTRDRLSCGNRSKVKMICLVSLRWRACINRAPPWGFWQEIAQSRAAEPAASNGQSNSGVVEGTWVRCLCFTESSREFFQCSDMFCSD